MIKGSESWRSGKALRLGLLVVALALPIMASAQIQEKSQADQMMHKLGRGLVNILTGWMEIPKNIAEEWRKTDPFTGFVMGTIKGIGYGWARTIGGIYDVFTFPFPLPKDYEPLMEPEFVLTSIWGEPLPIMEPYEL